MKYYIPEISWHNRDPVLSVDFQTNSDENEPLRLATGGTDSHVLIWHVAKSDKGSVNLDVAADLVRHQKAVNVVRWSPNGQFLASGDDESIIFIWKQRTDKDPAPTSEQSEEQYMETWIIHKTLRGHLEDVLDISWSPDSLQLASGSVDNKLMIWDINRGRHTALIADHKGFVQGVTWDPLSHFIGTCSTDRPACILPCGEASLAVRWSPICYKPRQEGPSPVFPLAHRLVLAVATRRSVLLYDTQQKTPIAFVNNVHYTRLTDLTWSPDGRILVASSTDGFCSIITFNEGELGEEMPLVKGSELVTTPEQQGKLENNKPESVVKPQGISKFVVPERSPKTSTVKDKVKTPVKIDVIEEVAMPSWSDNSSSEIIKPKELKEAIPMVIDDSDDIKLVYDESTGFNKPEDKSVVQNTPQSEKQNSESPKDRFEDKVVTSFMKQAKVMDVPQAATHKVPGPDTPRRVSFITLSSPKNSKKKC
ncbi:Chromatin assembly factor 1 subunit B [Eumeta japonica]|uniref:Chromatin assembly factor 1 subunit B n=1 Tax=Eumeta variegata TaxID=151549 RepID=A0A4C1ZIE4_EUMVA|nr:Chromatin assembly factor 1 subunit B [Eumeta japonica]